MSVVYSHGSVSVSSLEFFGGGSSYEPSYSSFPLSCSTRNLRVSQEEEGDEAKIHLATAGEAQAWGVEE